MSNTFDLPKYMNELAGNARHAADQLRLTSNDFRNALLEYMADSISDCAADILEANAKDYAAGQDKGLSGAMLDRLLLTGERIDAIANSLRSIASLPDPIGTVDETWSQPNGLKFSRVRVPIGVIGMIYESRPNVTADAAGLSIKSGNACLLRGGSESFHSNRAINAAIHSGLARATIDYFPVQWIATTDRDAVGMMLAGLSGQVDMIIPRGGKNLVARVQKDARVPVLSHLDGLCHTYIHALANREKAIAIVSNAKMRRTGVCGATETVLIDQDIADITPALIQTLTDLGCEIRGTAEVCALSPLAKPASDADFSTEHLAPILNMKIVPGINAALAHIAQYGSGHTDAIITENEAASEQFLRDVDSAIVIHNASTQFADGGEFGFGAEIGIATGRLHARGPVGAKHLTTYKYRVEGNGQTRP